MRLAIYRWLESNAGDDAVHAGLRSAFPPDVDWVNIGLWQRADEALATLSSCDGLIIGGGTIVGNLRTWILDEAFLDRIAVPVGILGAGIRDEGMKTIQTDLAGPLHRLLRKADPIALRGPLSKLFLEQSGFSGYPLRAVGDPALLLTYAKSDAVGTAINVRARKGGVERHTVEMLQRFLGARDTCLPRPFSFFSCHDQWDLRPSVSIAGEIEPYQGLDALLNRLAKCRLVISERLHGTVLSHITGTPAVQIVYERKCVDYMASVGCQELCVWPGDIEGLRRACAVAHECMTTTTNRIHQIRLLLQQSIDHYLHRLSVSSQGRRTHP